MDTWILILALIVSVLSLAVTVIACFSYRKMLREKDRNIVHAIREQDQLLRELEHTRIEKETMKEIIKVINPLK